MGADINTADIRGMTPLMLAIATDHGNQAVIDLLLARGADPNIKSRAGETALIGPASSRAVPPWMR